MKKDYSILWVDGEGHLREIMCELLTDDGYDCTMAASGDEAIQCLKEKVFDLVITDFNMPRMDGANLLFWCRMNDYHQPFIFISSRLEDIPMEDLVLKDCCTSLLNKPFSIEQLTAEIEKARNRQHDFDCFGIKIPLNKGDYRNSFPGQHFLSSNG